MKRNLLLISFLLIFVNLFSQGYEISVRIKGMSNENLILGHHFGNSLYPDDTITLNDQGAGVFKGDEPLPGGMYFVYMPGNKYYDFLLNDDQIFKLESDTGDFVNNCKFTDSDDNTLFFDYQKYMTKNQKLVNELLDKKKELEDNRRLKKLMKNLNRLMRK